MPERYGVLIPDEISNDLKRLASERGICGSEVVARALKLYFAAVRGVSRAWRLA